MLSSNNYVLRLRRDTRNGYSCSLNNLIKLFLLSGHIHQTGVVNSMPIWLSVILLMHY